MQSVKGCCCIQNNLKIFFGLVKMNLAVKLFNLGILKFLCENVHFEFSNMQKFLRF